MAEKIIVYSGTGWRGCHQVKEFLSQQEIPFEDRNIRENAQYMEELHRLGHRSIPVTLIGKEVLVGYDRELLQEALKKAGY